MSKHLQGADSWRKLKRHIRRHQEQTTKHITADILALLDDSDRVLPMRSCLQWWLTYLTEDARAAKAHAPEAGSYALSACACAGTVIRHYQHPDTGAEAVAIANEAVAATLVAGRYGSLRHDQTQLANDCWQRCADLARQVVVQYDC